MLIKSVINIRSDIDQNSFDDVIMSNMASIE